MRDLSRRGPTPRAIKAFFATARRVAPAMPEAMRAVQDMAWHEGHLALERALSH